MGTRADFYDGRGPDAEWLGSIAWDGYPDGLDPLNLRPIGANDWREGVAEFLAPRDDATMPEQGWPWPWDDSGTTDYAYAYEAGRVYGSSFGGPWFDVLVGDPPAEFPNMAERKNVRLDKGSGLLTFEAP